MIASAEDSLAFLPEMLAGLGLGAPVAGQLRCTGSDALPSVFAVTEFATASIAAAGLAAAELIAEQSGVPAQVVVDRRLASLWFGVSLAPAGWSLPPLWDAVAGDYRCADGWIRLHTNAAHHRAAALRILGTAPEREAVANAVARWHGDDLETAVVDAGGCAARMLSARAWADHPQGRAVGAEALVATNHFPSDALGRRWRPVAGRPLAGVRVLDLTRILAGPVATRFLAGLGADVLRIDPPGWDEPSVIPDVGLGKRCARIDLRTPEGRQRFQTLLADADVFVHGLRNGALAAKGLDTATIRRLNPGLVEVSLDAYGFTGPWRERRGFDSLVQMSSGIAEAGMHMLGRDKPFPLPVQALDHATGYLMAAAALAGLRRRAASAHGSSARLSLARSAALLVEGPQGDPHRSFAPAGAADHDPLPEATGWGAAHRLRSPVLIAGHPLTWAVPAGPLGRDPPAWPSAA